MRSKIIFPLLLLGLVVLAFAVFRSQPRVTAPPVIAETTENPARQPAPGAGLKVVNRPPTPTATPASPAVAPARTAEELQTLAMHDDADSLNAILAELANPDPEIRAAAREAAVQFGDRAAVPLLRAAAAVTDDLEEKKALLDAADFLELPPLAVPAGTNAAPR
jgi:predicted component of type VI protein secretion system